MTPCPREPEIIRAITTGAGDATLSPDETDHLRDCADCREAAAISSALLDDPSSAWEEASAPSADIVWFRAQLKARAEAAKLAARPVFFVQALAAAAVVGGVAGMAGTMGTLDISAVASRGILLAFAVWLVIVPVAVYLVATED
jgi:hypothetical protein